MADVYAFDRFTANPLGSVLNSPENGMPVMYPFVRDPNYKGVRRGDWIRLFLSGGKAIEIYTLWRPGKTVLCWVTAVPWMHFFVSAAVLQALEITNAHSPSVLPEVGIIAGELPTPKMHGGSKKILLQLPKNFRQSFLWKLVWALGSILCVASLLATYILLSKEDPHAFYAWLGFQLLWLVLRLVFYHLAESADHLPFPGLLGLEWQHLSGDQKARALKLLWVLARYQTHLHPRGS
jgi:hypothetical protein